MENKTKQHYKLFGRQVGSNMGIYLLHKRKEKVLPRRSQVRNITVAQGMFIVEKKHHKK